MTSQTLDSLLAHDTSDMLGAVASLTDQLPDGLARARAAQDALTASWPGDATATPRSLVICGMGGSGVGGDVLSAAANTTVPVIAVKGYDLPSWVNDEDRVICVSYSGATSETISCFHAALRRSVVHAVITTGGELADLARAEQVPVVELPSGMQPRAAVGVIFGALAGVAETLHVVHDAGALVAEAVDGVQLVTSQHAGAGAGSEIDPPALELARTLYDQVVIVYGADHTAAVAHRWKAQVNENSKVPCWASVYPELDHNELVGWEYAASTGGRFALVELIPHGVSDAVQARFDISKRIAGSSITSNVRIVPKALTRAAATFEQLVWGDYVSIYLALLRGIDPTPVDRIHVLKGELAGR